MFAENNPIAKTSGITASSNYLPLPRVYIIFAPEMDTRLR